MLFRSFGSGSFDDTYHKMNSYSFRPSDVDCYPVYVVSLKKPFYPFSDCDLYGKVISECEVVRKRLNLCKVYFRLDLTNKQGASLDSGMFGDTEKLLSVTFHITDMSSKIGYIKERKDIEKYLRNVCSRYKITNIFSTNWGINDISINISTNHGYNINEAVDYLMNPDNLGNVVSGWNISKSNKEYEFMGQVKNQIVITFSPK